MEIDISNSKTIAEIQKQFSDHFPYLKIEFFKKGHSGGEGSPKSAQLDNNLTIGESRTKHSKGEISIHANQKVSTLENNFSELYGLNVQVFRKSSDGIWIETTVTDDWTLAEQNKEGEEMSVE